MNKQTAYQIIRNPVVTEKSTYASEHNQVVFDVAKGATKPEIKAAIESLFSVKVKAVNTLNRKGKTKMFRRLPGRRADIRRAIVTLEEGQSIDVATGL
ncbi:MAG: 50S ribosomal protein L23 [Cucumibacter sp.]